MIQNALNHLRPGLLLSALGLILCSGCPAVSNYPAPAKVWDLREPVFNRKYQLYVPTGYRDDRPWPVVVTCHGTVPADTAQLQMAEWKGLAENKGFLVIAPELTAASALTPRTTEQISRQIDDEKAILSMIAALGASRSIDNTRTFITGWSAGCYVALFVGLRHPDVFRGISLRQGNFKAAFVEPCVPFLDLNQPIQVTYAELDLLRNDATQCIAWLREHELEPVTMQQFTGHRRSPEPVFAFFSEVVRNRPWARVELREDPADDMRLLFSARASFRPVRYLWDFGDHERSEQAAPDHRYAAPGLYNVRVAMWMSAKRYVTRQVQVQVPRVRLGATPAAAEPAP